MPVVWLANVLLVRQPEGYAQMGIFTAAYSLRTMIIFLPSLMNNVGMSLLNNQKGMENERNYKRIFLTNIVLTQSVVLIGSLIVILLGPWLLRAFGKDFAEGYTVLLILVFSAIAETLSTAIYQVIQSQERMWLSFFSINAPWCIAFIISAYIYIPANLASGLAWAVPYRMVCPCGDDRFASLAGRHLATRWEWMRDVAEDYGYWRRFCAKRIYCR